MEAELPKVDLSTLPVVESTNVELDSQAQDFVNNLNKLQKEVQASKTAAKIISPSKNQKTVKNKGLDAKIDAATEDEGLLADHREERRKLAERLEKDPVFRKQYMAELEAKNLAAREADNILDNDEDAYVEALSNELTEEDIAALADDLKEVVPKEQVNLASKLKRMGIVFQNVTTVNIYMCKCHHSS